MTIEFKKVITKEDQIKLSQMADEIWNEYWPSRIGQAQTTYMVEKFQSESAIERDMAHAGYEYWFAVDVSPDNPDCKPKVVGYTGGHNEPDTNRFFISKIYLYRESRGHGFCSRIIEFYKNLCKERGFHAMYLTVNKNNTHAQDVYRAGGFEIIDSVENDIGSGFVMDDYIMEKKLTKTN